MQAEIIITILCAPLALVFLASLVYLYLHVRHAPLVDEDGNRIEE